MTEDSSSTVSIVKQACRLSLSSVSRADVHYRAVLALRTQEQLRGTPFTEGEIDCEIVARIRRTSLIDSASSASVLQQAAVAMLHRGTLHGKDLAVPAMPLIFHHFDSVMCARAEVSSLMPRV